jgi:hypothetical protein
MALERDCQVHDDGKVGKGMSRFGETDHGTTWSRRRLDEGVLRTGVEAHVVRTGVNCIPDKQVRSVWVLRILSFTDDGTWCKCTRSLRRRITGICGLPIQYATNFRKQGLVDFARGRGKGPAGE